MGNTTPASGSGWEPPSVEHLQELLPQYEISRLLGHGGMGAVYEGVQSNLQRQVAIKILPETLGEDDEGLNFKERFKLEARSMANLDHPGIISVYDFGETREGQLYFVMEFIDGMDIHQYLRHHGGKLPEESAIAITAYVLDALGYAHERGIVHRDIKPANIMIKSDGRVKVADFGLVKRLSESGEGSPDSAAALTMTNVAIGTPDFVAPESLEIGRTVDHRADLYAVGVMFYQMLTGAVPRGNFKPPSGKIPELDPRLDPIVMRAMEADPEDRFVSADEFRSAVDRILTTLVPEDPGTEAVAPAVSHENTGPVTPGGKRLHITSVQKKSPAPKGSTGPVKGQPPAQSHSARGATQAKKPNATLIAAIVVIGLAVIGGAAALFMGGGDGSGESDGGTGKTDPTFAETTGKSKDGGSSGSGKGKASEKGKDKGRRSKSPPQPPAPNPPVAKAPDKAKSPPEPGPEVVQNPTPPKQPETHPEPEPATPDPPKPAPDPVTPEPTPEDPVTKRLAEIDGQYREFFEKPYAEALATLNGQFTGALKREELAASQTGNLDLVLAFQNEARRIGNGQGAGPAEDADIPPKLKEWRTTWHTRHQELLDQQAANRKDAHARRDRALDNYQQELVKAQDIAAAQRVKALREQLAANLEAGVATAAIAGAPPEPVRSGAGNPNQPVITEVPKLEYPPKRPTRVGELVRVLIYGSEEPEVIARDVVDFRVPANGTQKAIVLKTDGKVEVTKSGSAGSGRVFTQIESVNNSLTNIVSFDVELNSGEWGVALDSKGKLIVWGWEPQVAAAPAETGKFVTVFAPSGQWGAGLMEEGRIRSWPRTVSLQNWANELNSVVDVQRTGTIKKEGFSGSVTMALTSSGRIAIHNSQAFDESEWKKISGLRDAVAFSTWGCPMPSPATLVLRSNGEVVPVAWPEAESPGEILLPPKFPRDIESVYVGGIRDPGGTADQPFGAILSRSEGWTFFGKSIAETGIADKLDRCYKIAVTDNYFFGLRDPKPAKAESGGPVTPTTKVKAPMWLEQARRQGGKLRAWGILNRKPIEEREFLKEFKGSTYHTVVAGDGADATLLAVSKNGKGIRTVWKAEEESWSSEHDEMIIDDRGSCAFFDGKQLLETWRKPVSYRSVGAFDRDSPILTGHWNSFFIFRNDAGQIQFKGVHPSDHPAFFQPFLDEVAALNPRLVRKGVSTRTPIWVVDEKNRLHGWEIDPKAGRKEALAIESQPPEPISEFALGTGTRLHGKWLALGESGAVYSESRGGFAKPVEEWSPAIAIRSFPHNPAGKQFGVVALQQADGTWRSVGPVAEVNEFVASIGPAIDLGVLQRVEGDNVVHRLVVWIEP